MASIDELRNRFNGMTLAQKKQFITTQKTQLQGSNNVAHKQFLNECIQKYNSEAQGNTKTTSSDNISSRKTEIQGAATSKPGQYYGEKSDSIENFLNNDEVYRYTLKRYKRNAIPGYIAWIPSFIVLVYFAITGREIAFTRSHLFEIWVIIWFVCFTVYIIAIEVGKHMAKNQALQRYNESVKYR